MAINPATRKATLSISVPSDQREAFFAALTILKHHDERLFSSASALIVQAVLDAAQQLVEHDDQAGAFVPATITSPVRPRLAPQSASAQEENGG